MNDQIKVVFVSNYNVSYAEKIIPAADISEQISTAGTEASGTGNMKLMLNGAVTLGTFDGANLEILNQAGEKNNYIFGATVEDLKKVQKDYNPLAIYRENPRIKRVLNTLIDGTLRGINSIDRSDFKDLFNSILKSSLWQSADAYFLLQDFNSYVEAKLRANADYKDRISFGEKCLNNIASAGVFSSDRAVKEYAKEIWTL